jgi:hypothetical protein
VRRLDWYTCANMKTTRVAVELSLNEAKSLIAYLELFAIAMGDTKSELYRYFTSI